MTINTKGRSPRQDDRPTSAHPSAISVVLTVARSTTAKTGVTSCKLADLPDSIAVNITIHPVTGEWIWTGRTDRDGYGRIGSRGAHRVIYELLVSPVPPGLELDHVKARGCTSRACVSPWCLEPVTRRENVMRGSSFAAINAAKDVCDHGHPFDLFNTYWRPNGHRDCRTCGRFRVAGYQARQRAKVITLATAAGELRTAA